jgi:hypothetical protein
MMKGIQKANSGNGGATAGATDTFTLSGLTPGGSYRVLAYTIENGAGARLNIDDGTTTYYTRESNNFTTDGGFILANNTTPVADFVDGARDLGNYVQFSSVASALGQIIVTARFAGGTDGIGIAGIQLAAIPEPSSLMLIGSGFGLLLAFRRRFIKKG